MGKLHRKPIDYIGSARALIRKKEPRMRNQDVLFILKRLCHYAAEMLCHGLDVVILRQMRFTPYYVNSSDLEEVKKEARFARSAAIHGVFFSMRCTGKIQDEYKADFKPSTHLRRKMEECLADPDLTYKLII